MDFLDFTRCQRPDGTFYGTSGVCRKGVEVEDSEIDTTMILKSAKLSSDDLDRMEEAFNNYQKTGHLEFPFKMPKNYDDNSGTPEAVNEICEIRSKLIQDTKTGKISVPSGVEVSDKAKELISEWNSLDLSRVYVNSKHGNQLNVSGLGVMAGPRDSVPKDAVRGLVQYAALRRQDATLIDTPKGKVIDTYRDPFTGKRRPFEGETTKGGIDVVASQDHWERPFGIYGIKSENDVRNTVYMPISMNVAKGESSPARYLHRMLVDAGRSKDALASDKAAIGGFAKRYDKDPTKDYLPKGVTRKSEKEALTTSSQWMLKRANEDVNSKYVPRIKKELSKGDPISYDSAAKYVMDIAKQESTRNYFGGQLRFSNGVRVFNSYEQKLLKGIDLNTDTPTLRKSILDRLKTSGESPESVLQGIVANRS